MRSTEDAFAGNRGDQALMVELADTQVSKTCSVRSAGSIPAKGIMKSRITCSALRKHLLGNPHCVFWVEEPQHGNPAKIALENKGELEIIGNTSDFFKWFFPWWEEVVNTPEHHEHCKKSKGLK